VPMRERLERFARHACEKNCVLRSLKVALFVGTVLAFINHYDAILSGSLSSAGVVQILVTYAVPYCVATFGSASQAMQMDASSARGGGSSRAFSSAPSFTGLSTAIGIFNGA
jgi:hypothetical protein